MIDQFAVLQSLTLPAGATGATPRIVIGSQIPAELTTIPQFTPSSAIVWYFDASQYYFEATGIWTAVPTPVVLKGTYDLANGIVIFEVYRPNFAEVAFGTNVFDANHPRYVFRDADLSIENTTGFTIDNVSQGRGRIDFVATIANSAFVAAETTVLTSNVVTFAAGRAFEVIHQCVTDGSIASNSAGYRVRRNNVAGALLIGPIDYLLSTTPGISQSSPLRWPLINATGAGITDQLVVTLAASSGGPDTVSSRAGLAARPRFLEIRDIGAATDYPGANQI